MIDFSLSATNYTIAWRKYLLPASTAVWSAQPQVTQQKTKIQLLQETLVVPTSCRTVTYLMKVAYAQLQPERKDVLMHYHISNSSTSTYWMTVPNCYDSGVNLLRYVKFGCRSAPSQRGWYDSFRWGICPFRFTSFPKQAFPTCPSCGSQCVQAGRNR